MAFHRGVLCKFASVGAAKITTSSCVKTLPEVAEALSSGRPVVALESTRVAHGMPYPQNLELATDVSEILRSRGVIPATVAIKNGEYRVGLNSDELENLAKAGEEGRAMKCSTRELQLVASKHHLNQSEESTQWGATTVAGTMRLAHAVGINTFVTGGTGGVHRGGEASMDVSTDLIELSRTPIVVISAGVKSILDVKRTLEVLETFGVPTGVWKSSEFPAFFSPISGVKAPWIFDSEVDVAEAFVAGRKLGMTNGMLVAVPNHDPAGATVEKAIQEALEDADVSGIEGRDVTPFILRTVAEKTGGDSLRSNISLVKNNAAVGAEIALAISNKLKGAASTNGVQTLKSTPLTKIESKVICVGGAVIDTVAKINAESEMIIGTSNPGKVHRSDGGVGRNVAEVLGRLGSQPLFYTAIGKQDGGHGILSRLRKDCGVITTANSVHHVDGENTAQYIALLDHKSELVCGVAAMDCLSRIPIPSIEELKNADFMVLDANAPSHEVLKAAQKAVNAGTSVCFEPTSVPKARILCESKDFLHCLSYAFPNEDELLAMEDAANVKPQHNGEADEGMDDEYRHIKASASALLSVMHPGAAHIVTTLGSRGVLLASRVGEDEEFTHFHADVIPAIKSSNGAGDTLCGAFIHAILNGSSEKEAVRFGMKAAALSLLHAESAISPCISSLTE